LPRPAVRGRDVAPPFECSKLIDPVFPGTPVAFLAASGSVRSLTLLSRLSHGGINATRIRRLGPLMGYNGFKGNCVVDHTLLPFSSTQALLFRHLVSLPKGEISLTSTKTGPIIHGLLP